MNIKSNNSNVNNISQTPRQTNYHKVTDYLFDTSSIERDMEEFFFSPEWEKEKANG